MTMNDEWVRIWKKVVAVCLRTLFRQSPGETEENKELRVAGFQTEIRTWYLSTTDL
jgi:hypothetical protein